MSELLQAAKAVIEDLDNPRVFNVRDVTEQQLRAAVERTKKPSADFMEWWKTFPLNTYGIVPAFHGWDAGVQAERERIKRIILESSYCWDYLVSKERLLEKIDDVS